MRSLIFPVRRTLARSSLAPFLRSTTELKHLNNKRLQFSSASGTKRRRGTFGRAITSLHDGRHGEVISLVQKAIESNLAADSDVVNGIEKTAAVFTSYDSLGRPTGGADSANDVLDEILRLRRQSAKQRSGAGSPRATKPLPFNDIRTVVEAVDELDTPHVHEVLADLYFGECVVDGQPSSTDSQIQQLLERAGVDTAEAVGRYFKAARSGQCPEAWFKLGTLHYNGVPALGIPSDLDLAMKFIEHAATEGDANSLFWLGTYYHQHDHHENCQHEVGNCGESSKALELLQRAATMGHDGAMVYLAKLYMTELVSDANVEMAKELLGKAAEADNGEAFHILADLHMGEDGTMPKDLTKARGFYEKACDAGVAEACVSAGAMHYQGLGTVTDPFQAYTWYQKGAKHGSLDAWKCIASQHYFGEGVPKDEKMAKEIIDFVNSIEQKHQSTED